MFISRRWGWGEMTNPIFKKFHLAVVDRIHFMGRYYLELLVEWPFQWAKPGRGRPLWQWRKDKIDSRLLCQILQCAPVFKKVAKKV